MAIQNGPAAILAAVQVVYQGHGIVHILHIDGGPGIGADQGREIGRIPHHHKGETQDSQMQKIMGPLMRIPEQHNNQHEDHNQEEIGSGIKGKMKHIDEKDVEVSGYFHRILDDYFLHHPGNDAADHQGPESAPAGGLVLFEVINLKDQLIIFTPFITFLLIFIAISFIGIKKKNNFKLFLLNFDRLLFFITGFLGVIILLMWFATDHSMTKNNYNILWAWPTHLIAFAFINSQSKIRKYYFGLNAVCMALLLFVWTFLPQQLNISLIPIIALLGYRSFANYTR